MAPDPALHLQGVHFTYRRSPVPALTGIDLSIPEGTFTGIVGANGAGKSTLCFSFNRIVPAFYRGELGGSIRVLNADISSAQVADMVATVGMVFQDFEAQIFSTSLQHEVAFVMENLGVPREQMLDRTNYWIEEMGLKGLENRDPATLSGGQKQRLALASVLAAEPPILILDEPTTDLDPLSAIELMRSLRRLVKAGRTVVLVTHDLDMLTSADSIVAMSHGEIIETDSPEHFLMHTEAMQRSGVRPPDLARLFAALGIPELPTGPEAASGLLDRFGFTVGRREQPKSLPSPGREILKVENVRFGYTPGTEVFHDFNLAISEGECTALLGQNGSGKTTLLNLLCGIRKPWAGRIQLDGRPVHQLPPPERAKLIGIVFQNPDHQIFQTTCLEEVAFGLQNIGVPENMIRERAMAALDMVRLSDKAPRDPFTMTKGERKKLALASVLACEPRIILLDEPTTGLDALEQNTMMEMVSTLVSDGHTVLFITHSMSLAARYARRIIVMAGGDILLDGPAPDILLDEQTLARAGLITPPVLKLGRLLGVSVRSPEELCALLVRRS